MQFGEVEKKQSNIRIEEGEEEKKTTTEFQFFNDRSLSYFSTFRKRPNKNKP